jgi:hypothetical protein
VDPGGGLLSRSSEQFVNALSRVQSLVEDGIVEKFIGMDMSDAETVFDRCLEAIKKVG